MAARRGRPTGGRTDARERILRAAQQRLRREGYDRTTLRAVAADAGVDVALVPYYFGSKSGLFGAALALPRVPSEVLRAALAGDPTRVPEQLLRAIVRTWDDPRSGTPLRTLVGEVLRHEEGRRSFEEYIEREVHGRLVEALGGRHATERASAAVAVVVGLVFTRYVLALTPFAAMSEDDVVRTLAPSMRAALAPRRGS